MDALTQYRLLRLKAEAELRREAGKARVMETLSGLTCGVLFIAAWSLAMWLLN